MRLSVFTFIFSIMLLASNLEAQDTIISLNDFKAIPTREIDDWNLVRAIFDNKKIDYWEYRIGQNITCTYSIAFNGGCNYSIEDSLKISNLHSFLGFERDYDDIQGGLPDETYDYIVYKHNNQYCVINNLETLVQFLKPIISLQEALYYISLKGFSTNSFRYESLYYRVNTNFIELIMPSEFHDKFVQQSNGGVYYFPIYYIRLYENGEFYKKKIGALKFGPIKYNG
jgi:hypothetical protein